MTRPPTEVVASLSQCDGDFLVLGAGGKMGFHVCRMLQRALLAAGRAPDITVVSRFSKAAAREVFQQHGLPTIAADLSLAEQVKPLPHAANVIYLAGAKFGTTDNPDLLERMNVSMPQLVARHYRDSRIVALSTGCVYSFVDVQSAGANEASPTDPPGDYARSCLGREQAFAAASAEYATPLALVRLNYSIDLRYGVLVDLAQQIVAGQPVDVSTGQVNVIWQADAVAQILRCLPHAASPPLVINVTGTDVLSVRDLAQRLADRLQRPVTFCGRQSATAWLSDSSLACRMFGPPSVSAEQMIKWTAEWISQGGPTLDKPTRFENRDGNY